MNELLYSKDKHPFNDKYYIILEKSCIIHTFSSGLGLLSFSLGFKATLTTPSAMEKRFLGFETGNFTKDQLILVWNNKICFDQFPP